ncbi:MAG: pectin acetylesterase-family hydrolase [Planctomycetota bacterium]
MRLRRQVVLCGLVLVIARWSIAEEDSLSPGDRVTVSNAGHSAACGPDTDADATEGWTRIVPNPVTIDGHLYTPTCSNAPGTTPTFSFFFRKGTADGLVVFFNGGGSCWNDETCSKPRLAGDRANFSGKDNQGPAEVYKAQLLPGDGPAQMTGLLDRSDSRNPVRDWSMVFVPYCTGDVHSGSNTAHYKYPGTDKPFTIEHRGWDNMQVILHWMRSEVARPAQLLVAGSSAGAYGAATHYASVRAMFPEARSVFLGDSGQGVTTPEFEQGRNLNWNYQLPHSVFGSHAQNTPDREVVARLAGHFPKDRFGQVTFVRDATQTAFYAQMAPKPDQLSWTHKMLQELTNRQAAPNFRSYVAAGETHTILRATIFFTEQSGGQPFTTWLGALLKDDQLPGNQICPNCDPAQ